MNIFNDVYNDDKIEINKGENGRFYYREGLVSDCSITELISGKKSSGYTNRAMEIGTVLHKALHTLIVHNFGKLAVQNSLTKKEDFNIYLNKLCTALRIEEDTVLLVALNKLRSVLKYLYEQHQFPYTENVSIYSEQPFIGEFGGKIVGGTPDLYIIIEGLLQRKILLLIDFKFSSSPTIKTEWVEQCMLYSEMILGSRHGENVDFVKCLVCNLGEHEWSETCLIEELEDDSSSIVDNNFIIKLKHNLAKLTPPVACASKELDGFVAHYLEKLQEVGEARITLKALEAELEIHRENIFRLIGMADPENASVSVELDFDGNKKLILSPSIWSSLQKKRSAEFQKELTELEKKYPPSGYECKLGKRSINVNVLEVL